jgi:molybdopterin adenylyltransferase
VVGIDESRTFIPLHVAVLTISDSRTVETDRSGKVLCERASAAGHLVTRYEIVPDVQETIVQVLRECISDKKIDVVLATGGTGVTGRDVTPEAFKTVYEKEIPGFGELFRWISFQTIRTSTIQSRATAGVAGSTYLFSLPGSTGACVDAWDQILVYQLDARHRPCNFAELIPRLPER